MSRESRTPEPGIPSNSLPVEQIFPCDAPRESQPAIFEALEPQSTDILLAAEDEANLLTIREKFRILRRAGREDLASSGLMQKIGLFATALWLAYEWGPGNETITPIINGQVVDRVSGVGGIVTAAAITGGFTFLQQIASGATVTGTATQFPRLAESAFKHFLSDTEHPELNAKPWNKLSLHERLIYGFTAGTTFVATREAGVTGEVKFSKTMPRVVGSAALTSAAVASIAATVEAVDTYKNHMPSTLEYAAEIGIQVITNPLTWIGLLVFTTYRNHRKRSELRAQLQADE